MTASVSINPILQSNFAGTFFVTSDGYTQGDDLSDPHLRNFLRQGFVDPTANTPMWGGLAISESLSPGVSGGAFPMTGEAAALASLLDPATNITGPGTAGNLTGWTVFRQATGMIQSAQSRVPLAAAGMSINFYRSGTKARIVVQALLAAVQAWAGGVADPATIYWDATNLRVTNVSGGNIGPLPGVTLSEVPNAANSRIVSYSAPYANWTETGAAVVLQI